MASLLYSLPLASAWLVVTDADSRSKLEECIQHIGDDKSAVVIIGKENCGKTLLLFQAAVAYASQNYNVTYIRHRPFTRMPLPVHGMLRPETAGLLKTLTFLYMSNVADVIKFCAAMHTKPLLPDVLIIDDFDYYLSQLTVPTTEASCAKLCAILVDAMSFIKNCHKGLGVLLLGCNVKGQSHTQEIFRQFKFSQALLSSTNLKDRLYEMKFDSSEVSLKLCYHIEDAGLFITNVLINCTSDISYSDAVGIP